MIKLCTFASNYDILFFKKFTAIANNLFHYGTFLADKFSYVSTIIIK